MNDAKFVEPDCIVESVAPLLDKTATENSRFVDLSADVFRHVKADNCIAIDMGLQFILQMIYNKMFRHIKIAIYTLSYYMDIHIDIAPA